MDPPFWTDYFLPERTWREGSSNSFKGEGFFGIETERVPMTLHRLLVGLVEFSRRNAVAVVVAGVLLAAFSAWFAAGHLGVNTDTDKMFSADLPWRQRADQLNRDFPQFTDLLVSVIDAREPEEAEATAAALAAARRRTRPISGRSAVPTPRPSSGRKDCCSSSRSSSRTC